MIYAMRYLFLSAVFVFSFLSGSAQSTGENENVLHLVQQFFDALEKQDTAAFQAIFLKNAHNYAVYESGDSVAVRSQLSNRFRLSPNRIIRERMRKDSTVVKIEGRIAMVWAPYDLWVNDTFSHCGIDVFTLIKTAAGWKIATISYTMEKAGCQ